MACAAFHRLAHVAFIELDHRAGVMAPDAGQAIRHQLDAHGERIGLAARNLPLALLDLRQDAELVLDVMADLVSDDIGISEITAGPHFRRHLLEEVGVQINPAIIGAIERAHRRLRAAAARARAASVEHETGLGIPLPLPVADELPRLLGQNLAPDLLVGREDAGGELAEIILNGPRGAPVAWSSCCCASASRRRP